MATQRSQRSRLYRPLGLGTVLAGALVLIFMTFYSPLTPQAPNKVSITWEKDSGLSAFYKATFDRKPTSSEIKTAEEMAAYWTSRRIQFTPSSVKFVKTIPGDDNKMRRMRVRLQDVFINEPLLSWPPPDPATITLSLR
jgi:hypothetical protein